MRNILNEGQGVGIVFPFSHAFSGEPGNGFKFCDEVREGPHGYGGPGDRVLPKGGCPSEGRSFGHVGQGEGNFLVVIVIDFFINEEVELYSI